MRFEGLSVAYMKMTLFWNVTPCSLLEEYSTMNVEAASSFETLASLYRTIQLWLDIK
jgi:hypothetical protein